MFGSELEEKEKRENFSGRRAYLNALGCLPIVYTDPSLFFGPFMKFSEDVV